MEPGFQLFPDQASSVASRVDAIYFFLLIVSGFFTLLISSAIVWLAFYYRRTAVRNRVRHPSAKFWLLEATWIAIPLLLTLVMFLWGAQAYFEIRTMPPGALELSVVGKQWMWKIQHPQGRSEINELHVPLGRPIMLRMISEDVIHSFYVPAFRVKMDVLPGRYTTLWFEPILPGKYHLFCAEYCGTEHADMSGTVDVMSQVDYAAWLEGGEQQPPVTAGEELFTRFRCNTCHVQSPQPRCPSLFNVFAQTVQLADGRVVIVDEAYIRESIVNPAAKVVAGYQPIMPTFEGQLSEEQIFQLIEYVKSLSAPAETKSGAEQAGPQLPVGDQSPNTPTPTTND